MYEHPLYCGSHLLHVPEARLDEVSVLKLKSGMDGYTTRATLLERLKLSETDQQYWDEFYYMYQPLIRKVAIEKGLSHTDVENVVQETYIKVARHIRKYDPNKGKFRNWLCAIARNQAYDLRKKYIRPAVPGKLPPTDQEFIEEWDKVWNDKWGEITDRWDKEAAKHLVKEGENILKDAITAKQYGIFHSYCIEEGSVEEVCQQLNVSSSQVYTAKSLVKPIFYKILRSLQAADECIQLAIEKGYVKDKEDQGKALRDIKQYLLNHKTDLLDKISNEGKIHKALEDELKSALDE